MKKQYKEIPKRVRYVKEYRDEGIAYYRFLPNNTYEWWEEGEWQRQTPGSRYTRRIFKITHGDQEFTWYNKEDKREWYNEYISKVNLMLEIL